MQESLPWCGIAALDSGSWAKMINLFPVGITQITFLTQPRWAPSSTSIRETWLKLRLSIRPNACENEHHPPPRECGTLGSDQGGFHPNTVASQENPGELSDAKSPDIYTGQLKPLSSFTEAQLPTFIGGFFGTWINIYPPDRWIRGKYICKKIMHYN